MTPLILLSGIVVSAAGVYLIAFTVVVAIKPLLAERFLKSFASSARAHYTEQAVRMVTGVSILIFAPSMWYSDLFVAFGWLLVVTTAGLLLIPWQWHHKFGTWAIPLAIRHLRFYAIGTSVLGAFILYGVSRAVLS